MRKNSIIIGLLLVFFSLSTVWAQSSTPQAPLDIPGVTIPKDTARLDAELAKKVLLNTQLGDRVLGDINAPVTLIEYASTTCPHCGSFHREHWPLLEEKFVKTGKVKFIMRPFGRDRLDVAIHAFAHCMPQENYYPFLHDVLDNQDTWLRSNAPGRMIADIAQVQGFELDDMNACLQNQALLQGINEVSRRAHREFGLPGTPTFYINGRIHKGPATADALEKAILSAAE